MEQKPLVGIKCLAYNHEKTIRQCLEGFVMQKTDFLFIAVVHDDASTDHTADIIREYAEKYPDIIKPIYEEKNMYQSGNFSEIDRLINEAMKDCKYVAMCEGDDYWISPDKLQKQVGFLEQHPDYSMACCDAVIVTEHGEESWTISKEDTDLTLENLIKRGGLYFATAGIVYLKSVKDDYPECCSKCSVGDHPLQIMCGLKGKVRYFSSKMVAYRFAMMNSWSATRKNTEIDKLIRSWISSINMLEGLDEYSNKQYHEFFKQGEVAIIVQNIGSNLDYARYIFEKIIPYSPDCLEYANFIQKFKLFIVRHNLSFIWKIIKKIKR